jgi:hypothetical protein
MRFGTFTFSLVLFLGACGGDSGTGPEEIDPGDIPGGGSNTPSRVVKATPSFANDIQEIFDRKSCGSSACHGSSQQAGLDLRSGNSYNSLVNVTATQVNMNRVTPFDPVASYLLVKVEGRQTVGARMPLGSTVLDSIDIQNIRNWIGNGAEAN